MSFVRQGLGRRFIFQDETGLDPALVPLLRLLAAASSSTPAPAPAWP